LVISSAGTIVIVRFPFSDLSNFKLRPAVALARGGRGDWILGQITSQQYGDPNAILIRSSDFDSGALRKDSFVRPAKLFTANSAIVTSAVGQLSVAKRNEILEAVIEIFKQNLT
jgi:mRNA interferase MazF